MLEFWCNSRRCVGVVPPQMPSVIFSRRAKAKHSVLTWHVAQMASARLTWGGRPCPPWTNHSGGRSLHAAFRRHLFPVTVHRPPLSLEWLVGQVLAVRKKGLPDLDAPLSKYVFPARLRVQSRLVWVEE